MEHQSVVLEGLAALQAALRFEQRHLGSAKWEPAPGLEAAAELSNTEVGPSGDPWGEDPLRTAYAAANLMMAGVLDNLSSIHQVLGSRMPVIGPTVLARGRPARSRQPGHQRSHRADRATRPRLPLLHQYGPASRGAGGGSQGAGGEEETRDRRVTRPRWRAPSDGGRWC
jgi:hypothetical protein